MQKIMPINTSWSVISFGDELQIVAYKDSHQGGAPLVIYDSTNDSLPMLVFSPLDHAKAHHMGMSTIEARFTLMIDIPLDFLFFFRVDLRWKIGRAYTSLLFYVHRYLMADVKSWHDKHPTSFLWISSVQPLQMRLLVRE